MFKCSHKLVELVLTLWAKKNDTIKILLNHHNEESPRVRPYTYKIFYHIFSIPSPLKISNICHQLYYNNSNIFNIYFSLNYIATTKYQNACWEFLEFFSHDFFVIYSRLSMKLSGNLSLRIFFFNVSTREWFNILCGAVIFAFQH